MTPHRAKTREHLAPVDVQQGQWMILMSDGEIVVSATDPDKEN